MDCRCPVNVEFVREIRDDVIRYGGRFTLTLGEAMIAEGLITHCLFLLGDHEMKWWNLRTRAATRSLLTSCLLLLTASAMAAAVDGDESVNAEAAVDAEASKRSQRSPSAEDGTAAVAPSQGSEDVQPFFESLVVTATARPESRFELPFAVQSLDGEDLVNGKLTRSVPEALEDVAGVMVQKTSQGQGSPYLRGFTGFRNVFLIDGIRLNNSVLREGPNQYWNTVDAFGLDELEVVKGPVSVLYGSGAIGGTVNALTREPRVAVGDAATFGGSLFWRLASAEGSNVGRLELGGALPSGLRWIVGGTRKSFGDVDGGSDVGEQPRTGYREDDVDFKLRYALTGGSELVASFQQVAIDDAWRTHKTIFGRSFRGTTVGDELRRVLDQERSLGYLKLHHDRRGTSGSPGGGLFDSLTASLSWHRQQEERDRLRRDNRRDLQGFDVDTLGFRLRFHKATEKGAWTYGAESYRDTVDSFRLNFDRQGVLSSASIQGPVADDADYWLQGTYVQYQSILGQRLHVTMGLHYTHAQASADKVADPVNGGTFALDDSWDQVVSNLRFSLPLDAPGRVRLFGGVSQAFRAPNLSDLTRFDSARSNEIETPSPDLEPEEFIAYELGLKVETLRSSLEISTYYTDIDQLIVRTPTGRIVDGDFEVTKRNGGSGFSRGVELQAQTRRAERWLAFATVTWMEGEVDTFPTATSPKVREPLDRLMPMTAHFGLRWQESGKPWWIEGVVTVADRQDRLSSRDRADSQRIPPGGTPGYDVWTVRAGWELSERWTLSAGVENLTDTSYRVHGSGVNEAGRNLIAAAALRF